MTLLKQLRVGFVAGDLLLAVGLAVLTARQPTPSPAGYLVAAGWALLALLVAVPWELAVRPLPPALPDGDATDGA